MNFPIPYRKKDKWGFCDKAKNILIDCIYDDIVLPFSQRNFELALVKNNGKVRWINISGEAISPYADVIHQFASNGISVVILDSENYNTFKNEKNCLFLNHHGEPVFEIDAITCNDFQSNTCIILSPNKMYGAIDSLGNIILEPKFNNYNDAWKELGSPLFYDSSLDSAEYPSLFFESGLFGFKSENGEIIIEPKYIFATPFHQGFASVSLKLGEVFHINSSGERLYDQSYYFAGTFDNNIAKVVTSPVQIDPFVHTRWGVDYYIPDDVTWGFIDSKGTEFWDKTIE